MPAYFWFINFYQVRNIPCMPTVGVESQHGDIHKEDVQVVLSSCCPVEASAVLTPPHPDEGQRGQHEDVEEEEDEPAEAQVAAAIVRRRPAYEEVNKSSTFIGPYKAIIALIEQELRAESRSFA
jgi:hypothetical protein